MLVDTNVPVRLVTRHPEEMYRAAKLFLEEVERWGNRLSVHPVHVAEALCVLESMVYRLPPVQVAWELEGLPSMDILEVMDGLAVIAALRLCLHSALEFTDVLFAEFARATRTGVVTFDRDLARLGVPIVNPLSRPPRIREAGQAKTGSVPPGGPPAGPTTRSVQLIAPKCSIGGGTARPWGPIQEVLAKEL
jgi:predicted nucleic acid-binding protein